YCQELLTIRYDLQPLADRTVRKVLRQELGRNPEELFAGFDPDPVAVTTSGQIHKALSPEGKILAVKIQDSAVRSQFRIDLAVMRLLARPVDWIGVLGVNSVHTLVDEFSRSVDTELDFRAALRNAQLMSAMAAGDRLEVNANPLPRYSTKHVLTWEFIDGISVRDILSALD